jgi:K+-transporting ATPase ATPase C chain
MATTTPASVLRQLRPAAAALAVMTLLCGVAYPLVVLVVGQVAFHEAANGSLVEVEGTVVGSELIGQGFAAPGYFHPRPSAAGAGYDGASSSGSNLGPTNPDFLEAVEQRVAAYRAENGLPEQVAVPVDAVTASASGLDPHISVANAQLQAARVAETRGMTTDEVLELVGQHVDGRPLGILGDPGVNVLRLNLALDEVSGDEVSG